MISPVANPSLPILAHHFLFSLLAMLWTASATAQHGDLTLDAGDFNGLQGSFWIRQNNGFLWGAGIQHQLRQDIRSRGSGTFLFLTLNSSQFVSQQRIYTFFGAAGYTYFLPGFDQRIGFTATGGIGLSQINEITADSTTMRKLENDMVRASIVIRPRLELRATDHFSLTFGYFLHYNNLYTLSGLSVGLIFGKVMVVQ